VPANHPLRAIHVMVDCALVRILAQFGHRFRFMAADHSDSFRPPVPLDSGHRFRFMAAALGAR